MLQKERGTVDEQAKKVVGAFDLRAHTQSVLLLSDGQEISLVNTGRHRLWRRISRFVHTARNQASGGISSL